MTHSGWHFEESRTEYQNGYFGVERHSVRPPKGTPTDYFRVTFGDGVVGLCVVDGAIPFVKLYRPRLDESLLELPGGGIHKDEEPAEAVRREFREETGYSASTVEYLGSYYFTAWSQAKRHFFWLDGVEAVEADRQEREIQDVVHVPVDKALARLMTDPAAEWNGLALLAAAHEGYLDLAAVQG